MATLDQSWTTGINDSLEIYTNRRASMRHVCGIAGYFSSISAEIKKTGSPNDLIVSLYSDNEAVGGPNVLLETHTVSSTSIGTSYAWLNVNFDGTYDTVVTTKYHLVLYQLSNGGDSSNKYTWKGGVGAGGVPAGHVGMFSTNAGSSWTGLGTPYNFKTYITSPVLKTILSDARIKDAIDKTILSDAKVANKTTAITNNRVKFTQSVLSNLRNNFKMISSVINDFGNYIKINKSVNYNTRNDIRTKKTVVGNFKNDVRFYHYTNPPASTGPQSLGKTYIRLYVNTVEQVDVDINTININKSVSEEHTASFELGRAYDSTLPTLEDTVEIKYNNWTLFKGYIATITPTEGPETIRISCKNLHWKNNRTNVSFNIGQPTPNIKNYTTINSGLIGEFSWSLPVGYFTPETIDCTTSSYSDALSELLNQSGNLGWFYDVDETKKLWNAGEGNIIELNRQTLGQNLNLYNVLAHNTTKNATNIINKYRVQMGDTVYKKATQGGGSINITTKRTEFIRSILIPDWDSYYERLSSDTQDYGFDWHPVEQNVFYQDVFRKYTIDVYLNPELEQWTDQNPPEIFVNGFTSSYWGSDSPLYNFNGTIKDWGYYNGNRVVFSGWLETGYTINYLKGIVTLSDAICKFATNTEGECLGLWAPNISITLWKEKVYTYTLTDSSDPSTEVSNPLMFFTTKVGSYPTTILRQLNLSQFRKEEGYISIKPPAGSGYTWYSYDDTEFAEDYAYWQLSKTSEEKIVDSIDLTLDAVCYYNIDLSKRIFIDGITSEARNINSINYKLSDFTVSIELENHRNYIRTVSKPYTGD